MSRYFFTSLASRPMTLSGKTFKFLICSIQGGRAAGVYEASDPSEIAILEDAVMGRRGVSEIGAEEAEKLKKKALTIRQSGSTNGSKPPRVVRIPTLPEVAIEARPGVPSAGTAPGKTIFNTETNMQGLPSVASLVHIGRVNPPQPFASSTQKIQKASARADRAKVRVSRKSVS